MNIWKILSSRERVETLEYILEREVVGVEEVATSLKRSKGFVSQFLRLLEEEGILKEHSERRLRKLPSSSTKGIDSLN